MSELRQDPSTDRWVVIAQNRANRPQEFVQLETRRDVTSCPFCAGNEAETPDEVAKFNVGSVASSGTWDVRVVPNKYPVVSSTATAEQMVAPAGDLVGGLGQRQPGLGGHEVIIESPRHLVSFSELTEPQAALSFRAYQQRLQSLEEDPRLHYALIFKNNGVAAGASLEHVHSQLIALPFVPPEVQYEMTRAEEHRVLRGNSLMQSVLEAELNDGSRIVTSTDRFVAFCPAASRMPYETWVVPRSPAPRFELETPDMIAEAACVARDVIIRLEKVIDRPAYNFWLHTAPLRDDSSRIHWRIEIAPRVTKLAGFEIGSGCFINLVAPEAAAVLLR